MGLWKYIGLLAVLIGAAMGYVYMGSDVQTVQVTGKRIEEGRGRRGRTTERLIVDTDIGPLQILKFPLIGYSYGADEVHANIQVGRPLTVRVGKWPPEIISSHARPHIMAVH